MRQTDRRGLARVALGAASPAFLLATVAAALLAAAAPARAQGRFPPDSLVNLKFFPRTMTVRELMDRMRFFTFALGVRCQYCHVGQEGMPLDSFNFRSDDKRTKRTARVMLDMLQHINTEHLAMVPERPTPNVEVTCFTCHRGVARPRDLGAIVLEAARQAGLDSAVRTYRALREQYYGRAAYDFGEPSLNGVSDGLLQDRRFDDAVAILRLNAEFFPTSPQIPTRLGEAYLMKGDTASAIANYREALQKNPQNPVARRRLRDLGAGPN
jgi:tetratricopeptide (TPR) repeat protein